MQRRLSAMPVILAAGLLGTCGCTAGSAGRPADALPPVVAGGSVTAANDAATGVAVAHICWIEAVEVDGTGVRVRFATNAPIAPGQSVMRLKPGASFSAANSGHDGCRITALRRGGALGVLAESHFFDWATMKKPQVRSEWIAAISRP